MNVSMIKYGNDKREGKTCDLNTIAKHSEFLKNLLWKQYLVLSLNIQLSSTVIIAMTRKQRSVAIKKTWKRSSANKENCLHKE